MGMFASTIYGRVPVPESPIKVEYEVQTEDKEFFDGRCTKKIILATYSNDRGKVQMHIALFVPNNANGPVPVLLGNDFGDINEKSMDMSNIHLFVYKTFFKFLLKNK